MLIFPVSNGGRVLCLCAPWLCHDHCQPVHIYHLLQNLLDWQCIPLHSVKTTKHTNIIDMENADKMRCNHFTIICITGMTEF